MQDIKPQSLDNSTKYSINARIREFCKHEKLKQADLEKIGINKSTVHMVWKDKQLPGVEFIQKLAMEFRNLNIDWVLTNRGNMLLDSYKPKEPDKLEVTQSNYAKCPLCQEKYERIQDLVDKLMKSIDHVDYWRKKCEDDNLNGKHRETGT